MKKNKQAFDVSCIIMASGASTRFGDNKLLADFHGRTLVERVLDQIPFDLFKEVILVTRYIEIRELAKNYPVVCILHDFPRQRDTIRVGMEHITNTKGCMLVTCDQPLRTIDSLRKMYHMFNQHPTSVVRLGYHDLVGNPVLFPNRYYEELKNLMPGQRGLDVIKAHKENIVIVQANNKYELADVDTPYDLMNLLNIPD
ncbi:MAG: nucleotidyltransferase family protein [Epulopiscium sp.]|nr:nucleotidyltransferase family protein [Candidatus Epulonipiscium sp.]